MKKTIGQDISDRARAKYDENIAAVRSYLGPPQAIPTATEKLISGNPQASELLARGYPQYVAERVARSQEEPQ